MNLKKISVWKTLPQEERMRLVSKYKIKRSGEVTMTDNIIHDDGVTEKDLDAVSIPELDNLLGNYKKEEIKTKQNVEEDKNKNSKFADERTIQHGGGEGSSKDSKGESSSKK